MTKTFDKTQIFPNISHLPLAIELQLLGKTRFFKVRFVSLFLLTWDKKTAKKRSPSCDVNTQEIIALRSPKNLVRIDAKFRELGDRVKTNYLALAKRTQK